MNLGTMFRPVVRRFLGAAALLGFALGNVHCSDVLDLCAPTEARLGFFSKGDCLITRAGFFQGHEWLTWLGNRDLEPKDRFTESETHVIVEGNRRVDWPEELLIHLNNGAAAYLLALTEYTDRPENQRFHFLLTDRNDTPAAFADSVEALSNITREAVEAWPTPRTRALTLIGQANHLLQDSFSEAHSVREPDNAEAPWCVRSIKAYIERADGFETPELQYHGADEGQSIGHTTPEDSLYRPGRDCHEPTTAKDVERCLSVTATRARFATKEYLAAVRRVVALYAAGEDVDTALHQELDDFLAKHLALCP
jgi:hypothetical protein